MESEVPHHERIADPVFRHAVYLLDAGEAAGLEAHLTAHPSLIDQRVSFEGNYFRHPALLEFIAENPTRHGRLPPNIVEVATTILEAGAKRHRESVTEALKLVCSGAIARECGVQIPLIDLLCDYGADPDPAMFPALAHGEFDAVDALLRRGALVNLVVAAALGRAEDAARLLAESNAETRHRALASGAQHGHAAIVRMLLDAGEDPDRNNPIGFHAHSTLLHQAALAGHDDVVRLLVERGARLDIEDKLFHSTPLGWAEHGNRAATAEYLRSQGGGYNESSSRGQHE